MNHIQIASYRKWWCVMRWIIGLILFTLLVTSATAQDEAVITGKVLNPLAKRVYYTYQKTPVYYSPVSSSVLLNADNTFKIEIPITSPLVVDWRPKKNWVKLFLEPGDSLHVEVDMAHFDETLTFFGKGADNCRYLNALKKTFPSLRIDYEGLNVDAFRQLVNTRRMDLKAYLRDGLTKYDLSPAFVNYCQVELDYEWARRMIFYPEMYMFANGGPMEGLVSDSYYDFVSEVNIVHEKAIGSSYYLRFLEGYLHHRDSKQPLSSKSKNRFGVTRVEKRSLLGNKSVTISRPGFIILYEVAHRELTGKVKFYFQASRIIHGYQFNEFELAEVLFDDYKLFNPYPEYTAVIEDVRQQALLLQPGHLAPAFTLKGLSGEDVSLQDFKGQVVMLTFWMKGDAYYDDLPRLKSIAAKFEDKPVVFLNISMERNDELWRKAINEQAIGGIHAYAKGSLRSPVGKVYNIRSIPIYYVIDQNGMIVQQLKDGWDVDDLTNKIQALLVDVE